MIGINNLIKESIINKDSVRTNVLRNIKSELTNFEKENKNNSLTESSELKILNKIANRLKDSIKEYKKAGRMDLADKESAELAIVSEFIPKEVDQDTLEKETREIVERMISDKGEITMRDTKAVIETLKLKYPLFNAGYVTKIIQSYIMKSER